MVVIIISVAFICAFLRSSCSRRRLWRPWRQKISPQRPLAATIKTNTLLQPPLSPPPPPLAPTFGHDRRFLAANLTVDL